MISLNNQAINDTMNKILKKILWSIPVHATLSWIGVFVSTKLNDALFDYNTSMKEFMILWGSALLMFMLIQYLVLRKSKK